MVDEYEVLHSKFDIKVHKKTFVNYLEVIMMPDGQIEYAVPSHSEKLISVAMKMKNCSRSKLYDMCPEEYYFDVNTWLCNETGCLAIWDNRVVGNPNNIQQNCLNILISEGLLSSNYFR